MAGEAPSLEPGPKPNRHVVIINPGRSYVREILCRLRSYVIASNSTPGAMAKLEKLEKQNVTKINPFSVNRYPNKRSHM